jgi:hypothetical protein
MPSRQLLLASKYFTTGESTDLLFGHWDIANESRMATSFTISRRRSMVPIYKKWEASLARVQIVRQEKVVQMLVFLGNFQHGTCMNFVLKGTDMMESFGRSGKFGIRMVDAKFALPKKDDNPGSDFVCLDMPEYPIEHDDLTITFDTEAGELCYDLLVY